MFSKEISQNIIILAKIHGNVFPWQQAIMGNKTFFLLIHVSNITHLASIVSLQCLPHYVKSRWDLLYIIWIFKNMTWQSLIKRSNSPAIWNESQRKFSTLYTPNMELTALSQITDL